jgi:hypothetical protein
VNDEHLGHYILLVKVSVPVQKINDKEWCKEDPSPKLDKVCIITPKQLT